MRVVGGKFRGVVLNEFKGSNIRPTADRTKEAIFNILQSDIEDTVCLDLFCGTGSLGIEAFSRGAKEVVFTDCSKDSVNLTKQNLAKVKLSAEVLCVDAISYLKRTSKKFDLIFMDSPYADDVSELAVKVVFERGLLNENGYIIFERDKPFVAYEGVAVFKQKKYGKAVVSFIRKEKKSLFAGTFDPITNGHEIIINEALKNYDKVNLVIMTNPDKQPSFSLSDRLDMLKTIYGDNDRVVIDSWDGLLVDYMKNNNIIYNVRGIRNDEDLAYEKVMENYNVKAYPQIVYDYVYTDCKISSSEVRERIKSGEGVGDLVNSKILSKVTKKVCNS